MPGDMIFAMFWAGVIVWAHYASKEKSSEYIPMFETEMTFEDPESVAADVDQEIPLALGYHNE